MQEIDNQSRYARQTILPEIGRAGQDKLAAARVLCVGAGGLGCPVLLYLAAAGVGHIGIVDADQVDASNLQRQIIFTEDQVGTNKAQAARGALLARNSAITVKAYPFALDADNCEDLLKNHDVIVDATDNFATKFLINDAAVKLKKPWVYASVLGFDGQMAVFDPRDAAAPCYRCLFPEPPKGAVMNCASAGVLGALVGVLGTLQALETIKVIVDNCAIKPLTDRLLQVDGVSLKKTLISLVKDTKCSICTKKPEDIIIKGNTMYTGYRNTHNDNFNPTNEISPEEVSYKLSQETPPYLIDVREWNEWEAGHIEGADHCPLSALLRGMRPDDLDKNQEIVLYCKAGVRSMQALHILKGQGYNNLKSMSGGFDLWQMLRARAA